MDRLDLSHYTCKQLMELDGCTRCGECLTWCPTFAEKNDDDITPLMKIERLRGFARRQYGLRAALFGPRAVSEAEWDTFSQGVYDCTLCARCREVCPVRIDTRPLWMAMRQQLVAEGHYPDGLDTLRQRVTDSHNIGGEPNENRLVWTENLEQRPVGLAGRQGAEVVYFVGCVASFYPMVYGIPRSMTEIMTQAGVDFTTLAEEEWCCGFPLIIAGMESAAQELIGHNVRAVRAVGAKRLVTGCPSCYHTWKHHYPHALGQALGFEVVHSTALLAGLIERGDLKLKSFDHPLTYHDPCDLGRTSGIYDAPRQIIAAIPGVRFTEMADIRQRSLCCGGGGDVEMADPELVTAVARRRLAQAQDTGAKVIVSACQQCQRTLAGAARKERIRVKAMDISELVVRAMEC